MCTSAFYLVFVGNISRNMGLCRLCKICLWIKFLRLLLTPGKSKAHLKKSKYFTFFMQKAVYIYSNVELYGNYTITILNLNYAIICPQLFCAAFPVRYL